MLVVFDPAFVVFLVQVLHALFFLFFKRVDAIEHIQGGKAARGTVQKGFEPFLRFAAVGDQQIAVFDAQQIPGRGFVAVRLGPRRDQQRDRAAVAGDRARKVIGRKERGDNDRAVILFFLRRFRRLRAAGGQRKEQRRGEQRREQAFHADHLTTRRHSLQGNLR